MIRRRDPFDPALLRRLKRCGERLPDRLRTEILAYGDRGVRPLSQVLRARGWGPVHAVRLMREMGAQEAIGPLVQTMRDTDRGDPLHEEIHRVLADLGPAGVEPLLMLHDAFRDEDVGVCIADVLACLGAKDDRILAVLQGLLAGETALAASLLAEYGDARAIPDLARALDAAEVVDPAPPFRNQALFDLEDAIQHLGGTLTPAQARKLAQARAASGRYLDSLRPPLPVPLRRQPRPGRNEPCWCGSGKKYKKCHLVEDAGVPV